MQQTLGIVVLLFHFQIFFSDRVLITFCYLSVEVVVQVAFLVLCAQHVHDFAVLGSARRALGLAFSITFKAVLVEGMAAQEVN